MTKVKQSTDPKKMVNKLLHIFLIIHLMFEINNTFYFILALFY
jgi:hypothetical protein